MPNEKRAIRSRLDFSKIPTATQIPNLIEVQRRSSERFLQMDKLPNERDDSGSDCVGPSADRGRPFAVGFGPRLCSIDQPGGTVASAL